MASNQQPDDIEDVYFTPKENLVNAFQQKRLDSTKLEKYPEYYNDISYPPGPDVSKLAHAEYYEYYEIEDEYLLPPQIPKTIHSPSDVTPKPTKKRDVEDLYDENHYALPDINGCVTKGAGVLKDDLGEKQHETSSKRKESKLSANKMKIIGFIVALIVAGGIGGIVVAVFTGDENQELIGVNVTTSPRSTNLTTVSSGTDVTVSKDCKPGEYKCLDRKCIPKQYVCNGIKDCVDFSDEQGCGCGHDKFTCRNQECIPTHYRCNGFADCTDFSDEGVEICQGVETTTTTLKGLCKFEDLGLYQKLDSGYKVAVFEGNPVAQPVSHNSIEECMKRCDKNDKCNSFAHCPLADNTCHFYDKKVVASEATRHHGYCTTYYRHKC